MGSVSDLHPEQAVSNLAVLRQFNCERTSQHQIVEWRGAIGARHASAFCHSVLLLVTDSRSPPLLQRALGPWGGVGAWSP